MKRSVDTCATTTTKTKVVKLRAEPNGIGIRGRCRLTDKLSVLSEARHARRIRSYCNTLQRCTDMEILQSDWIRIFSQTPYSIRNRPISCTWAKIFGSVNFAAWGKSYDGYFVFVWQNCLRWSCDKYDTHKKTWIRAVVPNPFWCIPPFAHFGTFYSSPITRVCRNIWSTNIFFLTWLLPVTVWLIVRVRGLVLTTIGTMHFIEHNNLINKSGTKLFVKQWH